MNLPADVLLVTPRDAAWLAKLLLPGETAVLREKARLTSFDALWGSLRQSMDSSWIWWPRGLPACVFGVMPSALALDPVGFPWFMPCEGLLAHRVEFLRRWRPCVDLLLQRCPILEGVVGARHYKGILWLRALGFTVVPKVLELAPDVIAYRFHMEKPGWNRQLP